MRSLFLILTLFLLSGCVTQTPVTNRSQLILISQDEEMKLGESSYKEFLSKAKISKDAMQTARVKAIGARIAKAANWVDFKWEFNLVEDDQVNAFCLPGGKVIVYSGILKVAENDDQLATVMSHEVSHALARHGAERMSYQQLSNLLQGVGNAVVAQNAPQYTNAFNMAYGYSAQLGVMLPYSRDHEYEADEIGIYLMHKAGYDIHEAVKFWKNMKKLKGGNSPAEFFSTHPSDTHRIERIEKIVREIDSKG